MAAAARKKATTAPRFVPKRGQVLKRVLASLFACLPRRRLLFRRNRAPRGRRGNRVPAGGGHVEPEPDVANNSLAAHAHRY
ncbi:hypothetical protein BAE44_0001800 [Dichanthelium oligosanthes]|uniref:Uncharacterized protein n=1 Tax=Dichanthelium oligosanthes TaxID=888268 RepID=A0A1E5WIH7_9POAL|nr:hypothetical protein BAE44_0001800 [Dichanthelium oligosanthes]